MEPGLSNDIYIAAYKEAARELKTISEEKIKINESLKVLSEKETKYFKLMDSIESLIDLGAIGSIELPSERNNFVTTKILTANSISWKSSALKIIAENPKEGYTSPQLFELIHPDPNSLNKDMRRKAMVSLSQALSSLVEDKSIRARIWVGRGFRYYYPEIKNEISNNNSYMKLKAKNPAETG